MPGDPFTQQIVNNATSAMQSQGSTMGPTANRKMPKPNRNNDRAKAINRRLAKEGSQKK
jgi:hypothetical protein